jgi:hypothetical protein
MSYYWFNNARAAVVMLHDIGSFTSHDEADDYISRFSDLEDEKVESFVSMFHVTYKTYHEDALSSEKLDILYQLITEDYIAPFKQSEDYKKLEQFTDLFWSAYSHFYDDLDEVLSEEVMSTLYQLVREGKTDSDVDFNEIFPEDEEEDSD